MAKQWAEQVRQHAHQALSEHIERKGQLEDGFKLWKSLKKLHDIIPLSSALENLNETYITISEQDRKAKETLREARKTYDQLSQQLSSKNSSLSSFNEQRQTLSKLAEFLPKFREIFGDALPDEVNPYKSLQEVNKLLQDKIEELEKANRRKLEIDELLPRVEVFQKIFGLVDPSSLNPVKDLTDQNAKIAAERQIIAEHQLYMEGLNQFRETYLDQTPDEILKKITAVLNILGNEKIKNIEKIDELNCEYADLEHYAIADDRVYAKALEALYTEGVPFKRLHETFSSVVSDDRRQQLLTLFSAALSAPVVASIEDADKATKILETTRLTVPVFLKPILSEFALQGDIKHCDLMVYTFLVGRRTRQVEILLNPVLIDEEKQRIQADIEILGLRNEQIDSEMKLKSVESKLPELAASAINRDSENIVIQAKIRLDRISLDLQDFELRASDEARKAIDAAKHYIGAGGEMRHHELIEITIPKLVSEKNSLDERIEGLNVQVTEEATRALLAAKDYEKNGGDAELSRLNQEINILDVEIQFLQGQLKEINPTFIKALEDKSEKFATELENLNKTYFTDKLQLEEAIRFENNGHVVFMDVEPLTREKLANDLKIAQSRLQNIDFNRANSYIQLTKAEQRNLADQIATAEGNRNQADSCIKIAQKSIDLLSTQIAELEPFIEALHDMVAMIRTQHAKIAGFGDEIRHNFQDGAVHPEILGYAETIRLACIGERTKTTQEVYGAIANMKVSIEELSIDTKHLISLDKARQKARTEFEQRRGEFCDKARNGEIKGLHNLEVEQIETANTLEELNAIHKLKDKIDAQIREREANLQKLREVMESNKAATIDSLARFARQAKMNLDILDKVMKRKPTARFIVKAEIASEERIRHIIEALIAEIEDRESAVRERSGATLNVDIEQRNKSYKEMIHSQIYRNIFINPQVSFIHTAIRDGETPLTEPGSKLSTGQHTALAMMWLVRQAEYAQNRVAQMYGTKKEQRAAIKGSQRIMFFDGLFSNLSNESYINAAFHGLKDVGDNFQLIGLIHNPHYVNNKDIFPAHLVGKRKLAKTSNTERVFVAVEPWQEDNGMIVYTSAYKHNEGSSNAET